MSEAAIAKSHTESETEQSRHPFLKRASETDEGGEQ